MQAASKRSPSSVPFYTPSREGNAHPLPATLMRLTRDVTGPAERQHSLPSQLFLPLLSKHKKSQCNGGSFLWWWW